MAKWLGFRKQNESSVNKVGDLALELHKAELNATIENRSAPAARSDSNPSDQATLRVSGLRAPNPPLLSDLDYLASEEKLRRAVHGGDALSREALPQAEEDSTGGEIRAQPVSNDPKFCETVELAGVMGNGAKLKFLESASPRLSSFVRARVSKALMVGNDER